MTKYVTKENLKQSLNKVKDECKRIKILTQSEYNALSSAEKNREDTLYFIKE